MLRGRSSRPGPTSSWTAPRLQSTVRPRGALRRCRGGRGEGLEAWRDLFDLVGSLPCDSAPVEIGAGGSSRRGSADPHSVGLALEIGEMPYISDERESSRRRPPPGGRGAFLGRRAPSRCGSIRGSAAELELAAVHGHFTVLTYAAPERKVSQKGISGGAGPVSALSAWIRLVAWASRRFALFCRARRSSPAAPRRRDPVSWPRALSFSRSRCGRRVPARGARADLVRHIRDEMGVPDEELRDVFASRKRTAGSCRFVLVFFFTAPALAGELSLEQTPRLVEAIWGVVYSDGSLSEVESPSHAGCGALSFQQPRGAGRLRRR